MKYGSFSSKELKKFDLIYLKQSLRISTTHMLQLCNVMTSTQSCNRNENLLFADRCFEDCREIKQKIKYLQHQNQITTMEYGNMLKQLKIFENFLTELYKIPDADKRYIVIMKSISDMIYLIYNDLKKASLI